MTLLGQSRRIFLDIRRKGVTFRGSRASKLEQAREEIDYFIKDSLKIVLLGGGACLTAKYVFHFEEKMLLVPEEKTKELINGELKKEVDRMKQRLKADYGIEYVCGQCGAKNDKSHR